MCSFSKLLSKFNVMLIGEAKVLSKNHPCIDSWIIKQSPVLPCRWVFFEIDLKRLFQSFSISKLGTYIMHLAKLSAQTIVNDSASSVSHSCRHNSALLHYFGSFLLISWCFMFMLPLSPRNDSTNWSRKSWILLSCPFAKFKSLW